MATITYQVVGFLNNLVIGEIDVDDDTLRVRRARVINNSDYPCLVEVYKADSLVAAQTVSGHDTVSRNLPASIKFAMDSGDPEWGIPPAMTMADIIIRFAWPWSS